MRYLILILLCSACAHETTTLDRELALELVKNRQTVVQSAPPVFNINFGSPSQLSADNATKCYEIPIYGINGEFLRNDKQCR